jgi:hypothetical protein
MEARPVSQVHKYRILALPYPPSTRFSERLLADMRVTQECLMDRVSASL